MNYKIQGIVSVWLGHFDTKTEFETYIDFQYDEDEDGHCPFAEDSGLGWFDHDYQEASFYPENIEDFIEALADNSWSSSFVSPVVAAIRTSEVKDINAIFLLYDYAYPDELAKQSLNCQLHFVGRFPYNSEAPTARDSGIM